jgi:hypothetical protein
MKPPYLLSLASYVPGVEDYITSLPKLGNDVEWKNVEIKDYPGNLYRFNFFPKDLDPYRMVIFTDTSDVIFQCPLPKLKKRIYVCPEDAKFDEHSWWNAFFQKYDFHELDGEPIYNMGGWAMPVHKALELFDFMRENVHIFAFDQCSDQPLFNMWLKTQKFEVHPTLMSCLFDNYDKGNIKRVEKGWVNKSYDLYSIVHANGNRKYLLTQPYETKI